MRISTKAKKALIGAAGITALAAGTMGATTGAANAATAGPWYGCHGHSCIGKNAVNQHCTNDAATAYAISEFDGVTGARVTLRLRYSPGCDSAWATVTDTKKPDGAVFWIYDRGTHAVEVSTNERATFTKQFQRSAMVGIAGTKAQACIEVRRAHGGTDRACTPFFGR